MFDLKRFVKGQKALGYGVDEVKDFVKALAMNNGYIKELDQALARTELIFKADPARNIAEETADYLTSTNGDISSTNIYGYLQLSTTKAKKTCNQALSRLVDAGVLIRVPRKGAGWYRRIENESPSIEWETADISATIPLKWPFELENYALIYPKNIAVIAGAPNAGKTAFLLNFIKLNMDKYNIHYYSSEMGPEELKLRLSKFGNIKWKFDARERSTNFADVIYPDDINIIDYIEITSGEFYLIGEELRAIFDKLHKGVAVVALQKKKGAELGRGAEFSLEKPRLYLSMDSGSLKIIKAKNWAVEGENPNGVEFKFRLIKGAEFIAGEGSDE